MTRRTQSSAVALPPVAERGSAPRRPAPARRALLGWSLLSALSGCGWFLATASFDIWPLAWVAAVPLFFAIERAASTRQAALLGWLAGLVTNAGGFYWIVGLLERFAHLPSPVAVLVFLLLAAYQGVVFLLFAWAVRRIRRACDLPMAIIAPAAMVACELVVPFIFPWYLAITQAWQLHVIQVADLAGPLGVTFLLMMVNGALYDLVTGRPRRLVVATCAAATLALALGYGHVRLGQVRRQMAGAAKLRVGVVQPNVAFDEKGASRPDLAVAQLEDLQERSRELEQRGADLIVWSESSYPFGISRAAVADAPPGPPIRDRVVAQPSGRVARGEPAFSTPVVVGAITYAPDRPADPPFNSALMLDREGRITGRFDKIFLLMFGEYIPGLATFPRLRKYLPAAAGHFARGTEIATFEMTDRTGRRFRLGPMICYEDILPAFGRKLAAKRPHLLVNLTNDAWFGATTEPWQHLALAVFRSVELRTGMVRAVNTGVSALIDATGRVSHRTYSIDPAKTPRGADTLLGEVAMLEGGRTFYARVGDVFGYANLAVAAFMLFVLPRLRRRARG